MKGSSTSPVPPFPRLTRAQDSSWSVALAPAFAPSYVMPFPVLPAPG